MKSKAKNLRITKDEIIFKETEVFVGMCVCSLQAGKIDIIIKSTGPVDHWIIQLSSLRFMKTVEISFH